MTNKEFTPEVRAAILEASIDTMIEMNRTIGLKKLPVVPNTQGQYIAQYLDTQVYRDGISYIDTKRHGIRAHLVVYRVTNDGRVNRYFFPFDTTNFKNENNHNTTIANNSIEFFTTLKKRRANLTPIPISRIELLLNFENRLTELVRRKSNPDGFLIEMVEKITGRRLKKEIPSDFCVHSRGASYSKEAIKDYFFAIKEWIDAAGL